MSFPLCTCEFFMCFTMFIRKSKISRHCPFHDVFIGTNAKGRWITVWRIFLKLFPPFFQPSRRFFSRTRQKGGGSLFGAFFFKLFPHFSSQVAGTARQHAQRRRQPGPAESGHRAHPGPAESGHHADHPSPPPGSMTNKETVPVQQEHFALHFSTPLKNTNTNTV